MTMMMGMIKKGWGKKRDESGAVKERQKGYCYVSVQHNNLVHVYIESHPFRWGHLGHYHWKSYSE